MIIMKYIKSLITASVFIFLIPVAIVTGQEKSERRIKIIVANDKGPDVILDTLLTGNPSGDSIVMKDGKTLYLVQEENDNATGSPGCKRYVITSSSSDGGNQTKKINKEITVISSDSDITDKKETHNCLQINNFSSEGGKTYSYTMQSDNKDSNSERTKYVISRDGIKITVEGSDYTKVKEVIKEIEKTLDTTSGSDEHAGAIK
jgi:hypothetical protein